MVALPTSLDLTPSAGADLPAISVSPTDFGLGQAADEMHQVGIMQKRTDALEIRAQGWKIRCLLPTYGDADGARLNLSARGGDPHQHRAFFSRTLSPLELIFIKTGRNMLSERELASHTYTALLAHRRARALPWVEGERLFERLERYMRTDMEAYRAFRKSFLWKTFRNTSPFRHFFP